MNKLGDGSLKYLNTIQPELALVIGMVLARGNADFTIISGLRTAEEQNALYKQGKSKLDGYSKKSYHQSGMAIDFMPYPFKDWNDTQGFRKVWDELQYCAKHLGFVPGNHISWDGGHFELREV